MIDPNSLPEAYGDSEAVEQLEQINEDTSAIADNTSRKAYLQQSASSTLVDELAKISIALVAIIGAIVLAYAKDDVPPIAGNILSAAIGASAGATVPAALQRMKE